MLPISKNMVHNNSIAVIRSSLFTAVQIWYIILAILNNKFSHNYYGKNQYLFFSIKIKSLMLKKNINIYKLIWFSFVVKRLLLIIV